MVDGEPVFAAYLQSTVNVPTLVQVREPLDHVVVALLVTVYAGRRQGEVQQVGGELGPGSRTGGAEATVVGFGAGDDVLNIRLPDAFEPCPRVGAVDAALCLDDLGFN